MSYDFNIFNCDRTTQQIDADGSRYEFNYHPCSIVAILDCTLHQQPTPSKQKHNFGQNYSFVFYILYYVNNTNHTVHT